MIWDEVIEKYEFEISEKMGLTGSCNYGNH